jgi:hypothetical protein
MTPAGFEPPIPVDERPQTDVLDRAATGLGNENMHDKYDEEYMLMWITRCGGMS